MTQTSAWYTVRDAQYYICQAPQPYSLKVKYHLMASSTSLLGMMSNELLGEVTKKLKETLGFKSYTFTSSALWRSKRNIFRCSTEDTMKWMETSTGKKEIGGGLPGG